MPFLPTFMLLLFFFTLCMFIDYILCSLNCYNIIKTFFNLQIAFHWPAWLDLSSCFRWYAFHLIIWVEFQYFFIKRFCLMLFTLRKLEGLVQFFSLLSDIWGFVMLKPNRKHTYLNSRSLFVPWSLRACGHYLISQMLQSDRSRSIVGNNL